MFPDNITYLMYLSYHNITWDLCDNVIFYKILVFLNFHYVLHKTNLKHTICYCCHAIWELDQRQKYNKTYYRFFFFTITFGQTCKHQLVFFNTVVTIIATELFRFNAYSDWQPLFRFNTYSEASMQLKVGQQHWQPNSSSSPSQCLWVDNRTLQLQYGTYSETSMQLKVGQQNSSSSPLQCLLRSIDSERLVRIFVHSITTDTTSQ